MYNDIIKELSQNFIEYAAAVNTDRAIPDATSGLKPVAKRILYGAFDKGYSYSKPHVKCANIVGNVMADLHPHGDSSIYGALVRLAQPWVMRYPLIDFHGSMGNRDGDGPAAYRYTEARLSKLSEDGMLNGIKKQNVDFIPNYSETMDEPVTLPSLFPNLLCNPNAGIGVSIACNWLPHNLKEVAQAIYDYMDGKEPMLPGPDFPTGGLVINAEDIPAIMRTGHGSIKIRGKYIIEDNNIVFYELPYGIATEELMNEIGLAADGGKIGGIKNIRNESNRKGFRLVIECEKGASIKNIITLLFQETSLQTSLSYNQVALVDKTPCELNLSDCIKIYIEHNINCILKETKFDIDKTNNKLEVVNGLLRALEDIDNIIELIKKSSSSADAVVNLINKYQFTQPQAKAIVDMKLGRLAGLEKIELQKDKSELEDLLTKLNAIIAAPKIELRTRLAQLVKAYGDERKTELANVQEEKKSSKVEKDPIVTEPAKCVIVTMANDTIKRIPADSYKTQKRNTKGVKNQEDRTIEVLRTNTADSLLVFTNFGKVFRIPVIEIPESTNAGRGTPIGALIEMERGERASVVYGMAADTPAKYITFVTKNGLIKRTSLEDFGKIRKKTPTNAITLREGDNIAAAFLANDEDVIILTEAGWGIRFSLGGITSTGKTSQGVKGINVGEGDRVVTALPIRDINDSLAIFYTDGSGYKITLDLVNSQNRGGRGVSYISKGSKLAAAALVEDADTVLIAGTATSLCISAKDIPLMLTRGSRGSVLINGSGILSASKI